MYERIFPLLPVDSDWQSRWDKLMARAPRLVKKLDRERRIAEHLDYLNTNVPEVYGRTPGRVLDIGPGAGELLEILAASGHECAGVDTSDGAGGMGDDYLAASALMHERQKLDVIRHQRGFWSVQKATKVWERDVAPVFSDVVLLNFRGSLEQVCAEAMEGRPHHEHHQCRLLSWNLERAEKLFVLLTEFAGTVLRPGGFLLIHANGSINHDDAEELLVGVAERWPSLKLIHRANRVLKWMKVGDSSSKT